VALHSPPISRGEPIRGHAREGRPGTRPSPDVCVGHAESRRRLPPSLSLRSHNQSPPLSRRLTTRFRTDRTRLFMCSCISASGTVNQRQIGARMRRGSVAWSCGESWERPRRAPTHTRPQARVRMGAWSAGTGRSQREVQCDVRRDGDGRRRCQPRRAARGRRGRGRRR
jgi:hypothetical protein